MRKAAVGSLRRERDTALLDYPQQCEGGLGADVPLAVVQRERLVRTHRETAGQHTGLRWDGGAGGGVDLQGTTVCDAGKNL